MQKLLFIFLALMVKVKHINSFIDSQRAKPGQFPFFVQFFQLPDGKFSENTTMCGATLIHPQWILSAAHCFPITAKEIEELKRDRVMLAIVGTNIFFGDRKSSRVVTDFHVHPEFVEEWDSEKGFTMFENDVGVGKLQGAFEISNMVKTVALHPEQGSPEEALEYFCKSGVIVGIGNDGFYSKEDKFVRYASVVLKKRNKLGDMTIFASDTMFFSETAMSGKYPFIADDGGPYLCHLENQIVHYGIISYAINSSDKTTVIIAYETVGLHLDFILNHVPKVQFYREEDKHRLGLIKAVRSGSILTYPIRLLPFTPFVFKNVNKLGF